MDFRASGDIGVLIVVTKGFSLYSSDRDYLHEYPRLIGQ